MSDDLAAVAGWLGQGYRYPAGPPWPWDDLLPNERADFDRAVGRLVLADVPEKVALALCWADGAWHALVPRVLAAQSVQAYPERHHVRLIPRPTIQHVLGLPATKPVALEDLGKPPA